jgi:hypothetical protein
MIEWSSISEWLKLTPRSWAALAVASGMYLLLDDARLKRLGLLAADQHIRPWVAGALLVSISFLAVQAIGAAGRKVVGA